MKQIIKCFSLLFFAIVVVACSRDDNQADDNQADDNETRELVLTADKLKVSMGETVSFSALDANNKEVKDVEFYVSGTKVTQKHKFETKGIYYATAKKKGYKNSRPIDIAVTDTDGEAVLSKIKMTVDKTSVFIGDKVTFEVKIDGKVATSGYQIKYYQGDAIDDNTVVLDKLGVFKFVATKNDYATSEIVEVEVKLKSTATANTFTANGRKFDVIGADLVLDVDSNQQAILYRDAKGSYFSYVVFLNNTYVTFSIATIKVYVPLDVENIVYPHEVDPSRISLWKAESFVQTVQINNIKENQIAKESTIKFARKLEGNRGDLEIDFKTNDYDLEMKYSGSYKILNFNREGNRNAIVRR